MKSSVHKEIYSFHKAFEFPLYLLMNKTVIKYYVYMFTYFCLWFKIQKVSVMYNFLLLTHFINKYNF